MTDNWKAGLEKIERESTVNAVKYRGRNPRIVLGVGGNSSFKDYVERVMFIKRSGRRLDEMSIDNMAIVGIDDMLRAIDYPYDLDPAKSKEREAKYKELLMAAERVKDGRRPSVEAAPHALLDQYVLHTHPTALTIISCVEQADTLLRKINDKLRAQYKEGDGNKPTVEVMDYCDPGILLGIGIKKLIGQLRMTPTGIMQRNHGVFFNDFSPNNLLRIHDGSVDFAQKMIDEALTARNCDVFPYGEICSDFNRGRTVEIWQAEAVMRALYKAIFGFETPTYQRSIVPGGIDEVGCIKLWHGQTLSAIEAPKQAVYFSCNKDGLARAYSESMLAKLDERFTWLSPDHIVTMNKHADYIHLSDPTSRDAIESDVISQVKRHKEKYHTADDKGDFARVFVVGGMGVATVGGHYASDTDADLAARVAMQFAYDALLIHQGIRAIGTPRYLTEANVDFIATWEVEAARKAEMMKR